MGASIIDIDIIKAAVKSLKANKAASFDGIVSEHVSHSQPALIVHLKLLFSLILKHGYVPDRSGEIKQDFSSAHERVGNSNVVRHYFCLCHAL